jgi:protocatechuate 3,4-dioxygenase beta subunit
MNIENWNAGLSRRRSLQLAAFSSAMWSVPGVFAEQLATPSTTEGPFYPDQLPVDTDNDLLILNDSLTPAVGQVTWLSGIVRTLSGQPVRNAFVEIWQVDNRGSYLHKGGRTDRGIDAGFQGYGRFLTDSSGKYTFRTIRPVRYQAGNTVRAPHIHVAVSQNGRRLLTTQVLIADDPDNDADGVLKAIRDPRLQELIVVPFRPLPGSRLGELTAQFDITLGMTPADADADVRGGISHPARRR